jgi:hypothetical protein
MTVLMAFQKLLKHLKYPCELRLPGEARRADDPGVLKLFLDLCDMALNQRIQLGTALIPLA